jgi:hypothetical protein
VEEAAKWALREVYYAERRWFAERGSYTSDRDGLGFGGVSISGRYWFPTITAMPRLFEAWVEVPGGDVARISQDGRVRLESDR